MEPRIKHNYDEQSYELLKLKRITEELEVSDKAIRKQIDLIRRSWNDQCSQKFLAKADTFTEAYERNLGELDEIVKEMKLISNKMHEAELRAEEIAQERSVVD